MTEIAGVAVLFGVTAVLGIRSTWRLWRTLRLTSKSRRDPILRFLFGVAALVTFTALVLGVLTTRRLLGLEPFALGPLISLVLSSLILLIPTGIEWLVAYLGRLPVPPVDGQ